jgi:transcriptional regulator with XRE-family HTH domain
MATAIEKLAASREGERLLRQERFIVEVTELIVKLMKEKGISRKELAERLGKSKGRVSQLLDGEANLTLRTLSDVFAALGHKVTVDVARRSNGKAGHALPYKAQPVRNSWKPSHTST